MPLCTPQIPYGLTLDFTMWGQRLTAWAMAQPMYTLR
jgi:hypothetical protein